jgi:hypothetical protein
MLATGFRGVIRFSFARKQGPGNPRGGLRDRAGFESATLAIGSGPMTAIGKETRTGTSK